MFVNRRGEIKSILFLGAVFFIVALLIVAVPCQAQQTPKGKITFAIAGDFYLKGGDPHTSRGGGGCTISALIHMTLWKVKPDGQIYPALAKSWQMAEDAKSIRIKLDERAKWHNGAPVTAKDVKFSFERMIKPELNFTQRGEVGRTIDRVEILGERDLIVYFKSPFATFMSKYTYPYLAMVPKDYIEKVGDEEYAKHPIGAGPFRWIDYKQDVYAEVEAVEDHFFHTSAVKRVRFLCVEEDATRMAMLRAGEADIIQLPIQTFIEAKNDPNVKIVWSKYTHVDTLGFSDLKFPDDPSPFHDVRVRRACSYAIDRKAICENVLHGAAEPWADIYAPYNPGYDPSLKPDPYDLDKARALLKEAGYPNGFETTITAPMKKKMQIEAIAANLAKIGIKAKVNALEQGAYSSKIHARSIRGLHLSYNPWWAGYIHPALATWSALSLKNDWCDHSTQEITAELEKLGSLYEEEAVVRQARKLSKIYRESEIRKVLWANHNPWGVRKSINWENNPGWPYPISLEFAELVE